MPKAPTKPKSKLSAKLKEHKLKQEQDSEKQKEKSEPVEKQPASKGAKKSKPTKKKPKGNTPTTTTAQTATQKTIKGKSSTKISQPKKTLAKREVVYKSVKMRIYQDDDPIDAKRAKKMLGWTEESENVKFGSEYLIKDLDDKKIRCSNNLTNRPITPSNYMTLQSEILHKNWCGPNGPGHTVNGENIIIGETGSILNGQHTLIAVVLASQEWTKNGGTWKEYWKTEPVIDKTVITGISEEDKVVNTIDTARPRTLADVIFRSVYFAKYGKVERIAMAKWTAHAIKFVWDRTGASFDAFNPKPSLTDQLDFLDRHPKLLDCIIHIYEENGKENRITRFHTPGYSAGLLYLMSAAKDDRETDDGKGYCDVEKARLSSEKSLGLEMWDKACEFWVLLAGDNAGMEPVVEAIAEIKNEEEEVPIRSRAILVLAWNKFSVGKPIKANHLELAYDVETDEEGKECYTLANHPVIGGIDIGGAAATE